jgi:hypothetical protein
LFSPPRRCFIWTAISIIIVAVSREISPLATSGRAAGAAVEREGSAREDISGRAVAGFQRGWSWLEMSTTRGTTGVVKSDRTKSIGKTMSHFLFFAQNVTFTFASVFTGQTMLSVMYFYPYMYSERPQTSIKLEPEKCWYITT